MRTERAFAPHLIAAGIAIFAIGLGVIVARAVPMPDPERDYNTTDFFMRHSWEKFAYLATEPLRDGLSREEEDARIARFLELNALIRDAERAAGDPAATADAAERARANAAAYRAERADIENSVERIFEGRLTRVIEEAGLTRRALGDHVWPPVAVEFEDPPAVLVESPRGEIRKSDQSLLRGDLAPERIEAIEARAEGDGETSALVVNIGGIAMYPAIIPMSSSYERIAENIAHEWLHHYLFFAPLGRRYYESGELTTLNETVANLAGRELGAMLVAAYPLPQPAARSATTQVVAQPREIDFTAEMRGLRREAEALLAEGRIDEAEALMEERRAYLAENGYYLRRINQAYFAFHGSYADSAGSIDPIGPKLDALRARSITLESFVERARALTSEDDLDRAVDATP